MWQKRRKPCPAARASSSTNAPIRYRLIFRSESDHTGSPQSRLSAAPADDAVRGENQMPSDAVRNRHRDEPGNRENSGPRLPTTRGVYVPGFGVPTAISELPNGRSSQLSIFCSMQLNA